MIDLKELSSRGCSSGDYKAIFTADKLPRPVQKLIGTMSQRIQAGREANLEDYQTYWAIDIAHEVNHRQITPTLVQSLLDKNLSAEETIKQFEALGLSEKDLVLTVDKGNGVEYKYVNVPVFFQILIPIVVSYHKARTARLYNERDKSPLLKYPPAKQTNENRVLCEIITDMVDTVSQWYGYPEYLKQAIHQTLKYGVMLSFAKEEWHHEAQIIDGKARIQKEGLRYDMPHPSRMGYDLYHSAATINTDTGCEYAYHWDVVRYGDVLDNRKYWNRDSITFGTNWMDKPLYRNYFAEVFPCQLKFPAMVDPTSSRQDKAAYYSTTHRDAALFLTHFFWKLIPRNYGLGTYKYPVWHRFTIASDSTVIWAEPCAYNPLWFMGYDWDAQAGQPSSFSLECIPWQDHIGNLLSQMILTAKQNLGQVSFYDKRIVSPADIKQLENLGERRYRAKQYIGYDSSQFARSGLSVKEAFFDPQMQYRPIVEMQSMLSTAINLMERVLQITAQETGSAAQHYQSKEEIVTTQGAASTRVNFTGSGIDAGMDAWRKQLYDANMAYREDEVEAHIPNDIRELDSLVEKIGFKITGDGPHKKLVKGSKATLRYVEFARTNVPPSDGADKEMSQVLFQTLQIISQKPEFVQAIGVNRILKLIEQGAKLAGAPDDFDITSIPADGGGVMPEALMQQLGPILQQLQQNTLQTVVEKIAQPAAQQAAKSEGEIEQLKAIVSKFDKIFGMAEAQMQKTAIKAAETQQQMQIREQEHAQAMQHREQDHQLALRQAAEKATTSFHVEQAKAQGSVAVAQAQAAGKIEAARAQSDIKIATVKAESNAKIEVANEQASAKISAAKRIAKETPSPSKSAKE